MNIENLKFLLLPIVRDKNCFMVDVIKDNESNFIKVYIHVSAFDIKKIVGYGGKMYRSIKTALRYAYRCEAIEVTVDITDK